MRTALHQCRIGLLDAATPEQHQEKSRHRAEMARFELKRPQQIGLRPFVIVAQVADEGALVPGFRIVRRPRHRFVEQRFGSGEIVAFPALHGAIHQLPALRVRREIQPEAPDLVLDGPPLGLGAGRGQKPKQFLASSVGRRTGYRQQPSCMQATGRRAAQAGRQAQPKER